MNAGSAFMLSFMGQQDKAEQITDVLMYVMNFIEPFQKYVNPMGAMTVIAETLGGTIPAVGNFFDMVDGLIGKTISAGIEFFLEITEIVTGGDKEIPSSFGLNIPSMAAIENFLYASGFGNSLINGIIDGVKGFLGDEQTGTVLGAIGMVMTIVTIGFATLSSSSPTLSYILGSISIALEVLALLGGQVGLSTVTQFFLGIIGASAGGASLGIMIGKWIETLETNKFELAFTATDFTFDMIATTYMLSLM